ncbi:MAG: hypothetical protein PWQ54_1285 [Bacteroidales bacterium]|nr:hypothetical protein [Bacteroidales bacterium]
MKRNKLKSIQYSLKNIDISLLSVFLVTAFVVVYSINLKYWNRKDRIIASDVINYYAYLPASFVYGDVTLDFVNNNKKEFEEIFWPVITAIDKNAIRVTMGMSVMYAPAFLIAHTLVQMTGGEADGFSWPYRLVLIVIGWVYLFFALLMLRKVLLRFYSRVVTGFVILIVVLGTNLFHYTTVEPTMSHAYSFFLFAAFLMLTIKWHETKSFKTAILIGLVSGMIALVRPTNVLLGLVFIFWGVDSWRGLIKKFNLLKSNLISVILILGFALIVWIPQLIYWKTVSGSWFFVGYGNEAAFYFANPQIINNLFSYRKGWLVYTPLMVFAFVGITVLWKQKRGIAVPIVIYTLFNVYLVSSWWSWWYGGGFGMRAYVETYAIYALGFAAFVDWVLKSKLLVKIPILLLVFALVGFSYFQTRQYYWGAIHYVGMTKEAYWHQFLKLKPYGDYYKKLTIPDMDKARKGIYVFEPVE